MKYKKNREIKYIDSNSADASALLGKYLTDILKEYSLTPVFVCIGSDRVIGDSLGPMVGSWLKEKYEHHFYIYGTLENPVHALNLDDVTKHIETFHQGHPVIAIDASLGFKEHLGYITVGKGSLIPGAGVNKSLVEVGDLFITGIVGTTGAFSHLTLQMARLSKIIKIAEEIAAGIEYSSFCQLIAAAKLQ